MRVSVIVPTCQRPQELRAALASVQQQTCPPDELVVVHDDSGHRGPGGARNFGVTQTSGDLLVFLDDDCVAAPDWLENIVSLFVDDRVVAATGAVIYRAPNYRPAKNERVVQNPLGEWDMAANMAVRRAAFTAAGGFPSDWRAYEDKALALKLRRQGQVVAASAARVTHSSSFWTAEKYRAAAFNLAYWVPLITEYQAASDPKNPPPIVGKIFFRPRDFASWGKHLLCPWDPHARAMARLLWQQRRHFWRAARQAGLWLI